MRNFAQQLTMAILLCLVVVQAGLSAESSRKVYRWVDEQGNVHYGDRVPSEYATRDRDVLNSQGIAVDSEEGQLTKEEQAAAAAAAAEAERIRQEEAERQARDATLLNTYLSVQEIERLRDQRRELLDGQIRLTELYLDNLRVKLNKLQADAARFRPYNTDPNAPPIHENLTRELSDTLDSIMSYEKSLERVQQNKNELVAKFDADIDRFRTLQEIE